MYKEVAVFQAFAEKVAARSENEIVVIDTAPTGHTLLLLDASQSYSKEIERSTGEVPENAKKTTASNTKSKKNSRGYCHTCGSNTCFRGIQITGRSKTG